MAANAEMLGRAKRLTLRTVALGTLYVAVVLLMPIAPMFRYPAALVGVWMVFAGLIRYAGLHRELTTPMFRRPIQIHFSGSLGRFTLRPRGDGRHVEVRLGAEVVAEAVATDEGDELMVDPDAVDDSEFEALGAAIGEAIEMVALADEDRPTERRIAGPRSWGRKTPSLTGGAFPRIGSRSGSAR